MSVKHVLGEGAGKNNIVVVAIEGILGAGKSTLAKNLAAEMTFRGINVSIVHEPLDEVKSLREKFYADIPRYSYTFQTAILTTRIENLEQVVNDIPEGENWIILQDRSNWADQIFMAILKEGGHLQDDEFQAYAQWYTFWMKYLEKNGNNLRPHHVIYQRPSLESCMRRLASRNRAGEAGIPREYQMALLEGHDYVMNLDKASTPVTKNLLRNLPSECGVTILREDDDNVCPVKISSLVDNLCSKVGFAKVGEASV